MITPTSYTFCETYLMEIITYFHDAFIVLSSNKEIIVNKSFSFDLTEYNLRAFKDFSPGQAIQFH